MEENMLEAQLRNLYDRLIKEQNPEGFWTGRLSSSALSTATAVVTLKINGQSEDQPLIVSGYRWLCLNINSDGGFGDTPESESNVSTSLLSYAAIFYCMSDDEEGSNILCKIEEYLESREIKLSGHNIISSILNFYGNDYTFSVPILSMLALCGVLSEDAFDFIPRLPFELSLLPSSYYRFFNLQVVSYAIPALIGVGIYVHTRRKTKFSPGNLYRNRCIRPAIEKLTSLMPESGGFLEAIPLTAFVGMCLINSNYKDNKVVTGAVSFLRSQQRDDGSWPIDTDLSTWVTTLSIKSLGSQIKSLLSKSDIDRLKNHLLSIQFKKKHPFNGAKPGGWGWTDYSGSVPDADDTAGAVLALLELFDENTDDADAIINGCIWLADLQNSDGGFPTFCRGWGRLPFDSSSADLTGHALLAISRSLNILDSHIPVALKRRLEKSVTKATKFLKKHQASDGHWVPLWFGNQLASGKKNPVYGTARVCTYLSDCIEFDFLIPAIKKEMVQMISLARRFIISQQNSDGSWGGEKNIPGSIEETSLAISALAASNPNECLKGFGWLKKKALSNNLHPNPIGLYFAMLWYDEKMYPLVAYTEALRRFLSIYN